MKPIIYHHDDDTYECVLATALEESELHIIDEHATEYTIISSSATSAEMTRAIVSALRDAPNHFAGLRDYAKTQGLDWLTIVSTAYKVGVLYYCGWESDDGDVYHHYYLHHIGDGQIVVASICEIDGVRGVFLQAKAFSCHTFNVSYMHKPPAAMQSTIPVKPELLGLTAQLLAVEAQEREAIRDSYD